MAGIVETWLSVASDGHLRVEGQKPDNGDWRLLQLLTDETLFILIPVLDETGTARIRVIREPSE